MAKPKKPKKEDPVKKGEKEKVKDARPKRQKPYTELEIT